MQILVKHPTAPCVCSKERLLTITQKYKVVSGATDSGANRCAKIRGRRQLSFVTMLIWLPKEEALSTGWLLCPKGFGELVFLLRCQEEQ